MARVAGYACQKRRIFSIANVGRACEAAGVLNTQSIRNSTGKDFRAIIDTFAA